MNPNHRRIILITGASSGIGRACAEHLAGLGHRVYGTSRRATFPASSPSEAASDPDGSPDPSDVTMIPMDVTDDASVERAVRYVLETAGRLDVVVNNAGMVLAGAIEDTAIEEARLQFETSFFGVLRVCRAALPAMREQRSGLIVNVSSVAGVMGIPFQGLYSAAKFAVEGLSEALRLEVAPFGIRVVVIEPGDFATGVIANRRRTAASLANPAYAEACRRAVEVMEHDEAEGGPPTPIARLLARIVASPSPRLRYAVGPLPERAAIVLKGLVPHRLFAWAIGKYYRVI
jgi:NAD(P)-dependent dehydrogenase (short-subunit alcohol dehydrogenase family)